MKDLDRMFGEFVLQWHIVNSKKYKPEQVEVMVDKLYQQWLDTELEALGGVAPRKYFSSVEGGAELVKLLSDYNSSTISPPTLLLDEISDREDTMLPLIEIVRTSDDVSLTMLAVNLLLEKHCDSLCDEVLPWILDSTKNHDIRELASEVVAENSVPYVDYLVEGIDSTDEHGVSLAIDVLVRAPYDERVYRKLVELFSNGDNIALYASYLGKYGNAECVPILLRFAEDCNYMEFLEIRNAVEMLGEEFNVVRDFSDDSFFQALKGV